MWRKRFAADRLVGLRDAARPGRPRRLPDRTRAEVIALACQLPAQTGVPLSRWSTPELARELATRCRIQLSTSTLRRWPAHHALKPWQHRSWISIRDPEFALKAAAVLDLYARIWDGQRLGRNDFVICAEKTSIQARCRCHPTPTGQAEEDHVLIRGDEVQGVPRCGRRRAHPPARLRRRGSRARVTETRPIPTKPTRRPRQWKLTTAGPTPAGGISSTVTRSAAALPVSCLILVPPPQWEQRLIPEAKAGRSSSPGVYV
jgi:transposase